MGLPKRKKKRFENIITLYGRKPVLESLKDESIQVFRLHLSDSNKEFIINTYENDKENFVLNLLNQKNLFNLNEYQKINLEKNIINNINQIKKITFTNFLSNLVFK